MWRFRHENWNWVIYSDESQFTFSFAIDNSIFIAEEMNALQTIVFLMQQAWRRQFDGLGSHKCLFLIWTD